jgi:DNA ligase 1
MKFSAFASYLSQLEQTSKRLEITSLLTDLIKELHTNEIDKAVYLLMGQLKALYENKKFNIAEKMMIRILETAYSTPQKIITLKEIDALYNKVGDLGNAVVEISPKNTESDLSVTEVYNQLLDLAASEGAGSQEIKVRKGAAILKELDPQSAKYVTRIILGTTRLGFTELTLIDALAQFIGDKKLADEIEAVYSTHPDIGLIAKQIKEYGIKGLGAITIETGVPILSQKPQRLGSVVNAIEEAFERMQLIWAEFKLDGTRVQLHLDKNKPATDTIDTQSELFSSHNSAYLIQTFTRNLEETTHQYPDIIEAAYQQIDAKSVILDGEAIGFDRTTGEFLPFQETIQRKRKHGVAESAKNIPLKYFVFDLLYLNGESVVGKSLRERKALLQKIIKKGDTIIVDEHLETESPEELQEYFEVAKERQLEGLILKKPEDRYQAGARSYSWIKLKKADQKLLEDSIDCVILGYYAGRGGRSKFGIGGFLAAVYDDKDDVFKTVTKVGTGLTDETFAKLKVMCDKLKLANLPANVEMNKIYIPDVITQPKIVVEIGADEISASPSHTAGYALRFPRLLKFREDKSPTEITTVKEVADMFKRQRR